MPNYQQTKIYVINVNEAKYFGHTTQSFAKRRHTHIRDFENGSQRKLYQAIRSAGLQMRNLELTFVENFPCSCVEEAKGRERYWIENYGTLNMAVPLQTQQERQQKPEWKEKRRVKRKQEKVHCDVCDKDIRGDMSQLKIHCESETHKKKAEGTYTKFDVKAFRKQYKKDNKDKINEQRKVKVECPHCGEYQRKECLKRHIHRKHSN